MADRSTAYREGYAANEAGLWPDEACRYAAGSQERKDFLEGYDEQFWVLIDEDGRQRDRRSSSGAERLLRKQRVGGSIPSCGTSLHRSVLRGALHRQRGSGRCKTLTKLHA